MLMGTVIVWYFDIHVSHTILSFSLLEEVLQRLEAEEEESRLLQATLCLLEASTTGLQEQELLCVLAEDEKLTPPTPFDEKGACGSGILILW